MKRIIFLTGEPGVGKTTIGKEIAKKINAFFLDKDTLCDPFANLLASQNGEDSKHSELYINTVRDIEYSIIEDVIKENIDFVSNIVIVAPYGREIKEGSEYFVNLKSVLSKLTDNVVEIKVYSVVCSFQETKNRIIKRNKKDDAYKINNWEQYLKDREANYNKKYNFSVNKIIENDKNLEKIVELVLDDIKI